MHPELSNSLSKSNRRSHLATRFEQLANFVAEPNAREILSEGGINPVRALVIHAILSTPGLPRLFYEHVHAPGYRRSGYNILGIGAHAITVADGPNSVLKFYRHTSGTDEVAQQATIDTWSAKQSLVLNHLEAYTVPQIFGIEQNPLDSSKSIVTARQKRIIHTSSINVLRTEIVPACAESFISASKDMFATSAPTAVPDLLGRNNVLIEKTTGLIKLVDPIALLNNDPGDEPAYLSVSEFLNTQPTN